MSAGNEVRPTTIARRPIYARIRLPRSVRRMLSQEGGIAAVEFSLILPILVVLWFGGVEVTGALSVDRRLNNLAGSIGDLVARSKKVTHAEVDDIFKLAPGALFPYATAGLEMQVVGVKVDKDGKATVAWWRACRMGSGTPPTCTVPSKHFNDGEDVNAVVPETLRIPNSQIIMSDVRHTYKPALGYVITGNLSLVDRMFFVPRLVPKVELCETAAPNSPCKS